MNESSSLSAPEGLVLMNPRTSGREAVKLGLMELLAKRALIVQKAERKGLFGKRQTRVKVASGSRLRKPHMQMLHRALFSVVRLKWGEADGVTMRVLVKGLHKPFGANLQGFVSHYVRRDLIVNGLLEQKTKRFLGMIPYASYQLTAAGKKAHARLDQQMQQARTLPKLLASDPAQAAALAIALGGSVLLVEELRPYLEELAGVVRQYGAGGEGGDAGYGADEELTWELDAEALNALDAGMADLEASFDAATSDGNNGGNGGGNGGGD